MEITELAFPQETSLTPPKLIPAFIKCSFIQQNCKTKNNIESTFKLQNDAPQPLSVSNLYFTDILSAKVICEGENIKTRIEMFISIKDMGFEYLPGDSVGILPTNQIEEVEAILRLLNLYDVADDQLDISIEEGSKKKIPPFIPKYTTVRNLLETCLDLRSIIKKGFIRALMEYTTNPMEKRRLEEFCSKEGSSEYNKHILEKSVCLLDILQSFPSCKPSISVLVENLPRLMPRAYSIASSPLVYPDSIRIVFNLVTDTRGRDGICTSWLYEKARYFLDLTSRINELSLDSKKKDNKIPIFLRKPSKFRIPPNLNSPIIMIGPGTGVAPFIGFLEHRSKEWNDENCLNSLNNILLFGCRYRDKDYIYKKELTFYYNKKILNKLLVCFSRERYTKYDEKYVQDLFKIEKTELINLLMNNEAYLFICGDALNMARDMENTIVSCICDVQDISKVEAMSCLQNMEKEGRYVKDVWR